MTLEQREKLLKTFINTAYEEITEEKQNYLLGFVAGLAQAKKIEKGVN